MIIEAAKQSYKESTPRTVPLASSSNVANLKRIVCNVRERVLLRVLVCKDEKVAGETDICSYPEHKNNVTVHGLLCRI
jgi:hypothetical protein